MVTAVESWLDPTNIFKARIDIDCPNSFNHVVLGDNQLVLTLPALTRKVGEQQMFKPPDNNSYRQFWVEINLRLCSIIS